MARSYVYRISIGKLKGQVVPCLRYADLRLIIAAADIVKILESQPDLANKLRRVRGGYLKMQGTWMARDVGSSSIE